LEELLLEREKAGESVEDTELSSGLIGWTVVEGRVFRGVMADRFRGSRVMFSNSLRRVLMVMVRGGVCMDKRDAGEE
jgi:hypothetical protein